MDTQFFVSLRDRWTEIYSESGLDPYQGVPTLAPPCKPYCQRRPNASDRLRIPRSTLDSDWTDCLNLTAWFSYHMVSFRLHTCSTGLPRRTTIPLFTNHNVTACQSTWVIRNEPKIHVNSHYITLRGYLSIYRASSNKRTCYTQKFQKIPIKPLAADTIF